MKYEDLDKHFTLPKVISFSDNKIPRKLKKKVRVFCSVHWKSLSNGQRMWYYLGKSNPRYRTFLIKKICDYDRFQIIR